VGLERHAKESTDRPLIVDDEDALAGHGTRFSGLAIDRVISMRVPVPSALAARARMSPPWASMMPLRIARPRPVPARYTSPSFTR
jgi:hypothetical protein